MKMSRFVPDLSRQVALSWVKTRPMKIPSLSTNYIHCSPWRSALLPILLLIVCFALSPHARAVCQEGCLTNQNTALGENAFINSFGSGNTAIGYQALPNNMTGGSNTAIGYQALLANTTGFVNTAVGYQALLYNASGEFDTAVGYQALYHNSGIGLTDANTATGYQALFSNIVGMDNTATGSTALYENTGSENTADGTDALSNNTTGANNIALGFQAGQNLTTGNSNIDIGDAGVAGESRAIRIGTAGVQRKTFIAGISGAPVAGGVGVIVGTSGQLGTVVSSERFKDSIQPMGKTSEAILALQPVTFRYKHDLDPDGIPQFGLVAEQVEKVNPDLVARDAKGKPYTVRYDAVNAMLLNEFLKEHRTVQEQGATITELKKQIEALTAGLQKVSAQLELNKRAPETVSNNH